MQLWILITALGAGLSIAVAEDRDYPHGPRKSLNSEGDHLNAGLRVEHGYDSCTVPTSLAIDPFDVAREHVRQMTRDVPNAEFVVRKDSYTDKRTGVTYVYFRQLVNGAEVTGSHIQVNVANGKVISWGDTVCGSFGLRDEG
jgi:hypothetical protein